jgi:p-aminobenzoyl-glutamate transporter AbgT
MKLNMGSTDRKVRAFLIAPLLVIVGIVAGPTGALAYVLYVLAAVMLLTGVVGFCPIYAPFKFSTDHREHAGV